MLSISIKKANSEMIIPTVRTMVVTTRRKYAALELSALSPAIS